MPRQNAFIIVVFLLLSNYLQDGWPAKCPEKEIRRRAYAFIDREAAIKGSLIMDRGFSLKGDICKLEVNWECDCPPGNSSSVNTNQQENFNVLDIDGDGNVTYSEFALSMGIIGNMTVCCN